MVQERDTSMVEKKQSRYSAAQPLSILSIFKSMDLQLYLKLQAELTVNIMRLRAEMAAPLISQEKVVYCLKKE